MTGWVPWVIVACVLALGEALTGRSFLRPFAIGAALAAVVGVAVGGALWPVVAFVILSPLVRLFVRPRAGGGTAGRMPTTTVVGEEPLIGKHGVVLEQIANRYGVGCIELDGEVWTARAYDRDQVIDIGAQVTVVEVRGATALVTD